MATHSLKFKKDSSIDTVWIEYTYNGGTQEKKITSTTTQTINFDSGTWIGVSDYDIASGYTTPVYVRNGSTGNSYNMTTNGNWGYQSSTAPTATYTIYATEEEAELYEYKFKNSTGYSLIIYYDCDTVSSTRMSIANGGTYTLTAEPADLVIDVDSSTIDGECLNDLVYWQRTSPTTGTKYTLGDSGDNVISLRSAGTATYTFTNKSYSPTVEYDYSWRVYTYVDGVSQGYQSDSDTSEESTYSLYLRDYVTSSYYSNYDYEGYSYSATGTKYSGDYATLSPGEVEYIYVHFSSPTVYYPYELRVRIDGTRYSTYDESDDYNEDTYISFEDILSSTLYSNYDYVGYRTSSSGTIKTGTGYTLSSTSGTTLYIEFETPTVYYPVKLKAYIDGEYIDDYDVSDTTNEDSNIDISDYLDSSLFSTFDFDYYTKNTSTTHYTSYSSVSLTASTTTTLHVYFKSKTKYYPYNIYVYVDGERIDDYDTSSSSNQNTSISLSAVLSSTLYSEHVFDYYTIGTSTSHYTQDSVVLTADTTTNIYAYFKTLYPYDIDVYINGTLSGTYGATDANNQSATINAYNILGSTVFDGFAFQYYRKGTSTTNYTNYTSISLTSGTTTTIKMYFKSYYGYDISVYIDGDRMANYDVSSTSNTSSSINLYTVLGATLFSPPYQFSYYTVGTSSTQNTTYSSISLNPNVITYIYAYFETIKCVVTLKHYTGDTLAETTTHYVNPGSTFTFSPGYVRTYTGYHYVNTTNTSGTAVTSQTINQDTLFNMNYAIDTFTITFQHYRGDKLYTTTTTTANYGSTITVSNYKIETIPNCVLNTVSSTSISNITSANTVQLYYRFEWTNPKVKGNVFNILASEWTNLQAFINDQRTTNYSFSAVSRGDTFTADLYNEIVDAIGVGSEVEHGMKVTATLINALRDNANNM